MNELDGIEKTYMLKFQLNCLQDDMERFKTCLDVADENKKLTKTASPDFLPCALIVGCADGDKGITVLGSRSALSL